jgi:hypothetical protein
MAPQTKSTMIAPMVAPIRPGGAYFFLPGLKALRWLADLET